MSNAEKRNQSPSSSSESNMHNERLVDLSEDEQLQRAIKMSEKEDIFRVGIYCYKKLNNSIKHILKNALISIK